MNSGFRQYFEVRTVMLRRYRAGVELRHLRYFVAVARELHFTRAAAALRVAQPALSRQIRQLEDEVGVALLVRNRRGVQLTAAGAALLADAEALLVQSRKVLDVARRADAAGTSLNLGYVWGLFHTLAPAVVKHFRAAHPEVSVNLLDLTATRQARALTEGKIDLGFIGFSDESDAAGLERRQIGECEFVAALPSNHPAARRRRVDLKTLSADFFLNIAEEAYPGASRRVRDACEHAGFRPRSVQAPERGHTILGLVAAGCGVAVLPAPLQALPHAGVVFRRLTDPPRAALFIAWRRRPSNPAIQAFLECVPADGAGDLSEPVSRTSRSRRPGP